MKSIVDTLYEAQKHNSWLTDYQADALRDFVGIFTGDLDDPTGKKDEIVKLSNAEKRNLANAWDILDDIIKHPEISTIDIKDWIKLIRRMIDDVDNYSLGAMKDLVGDNADVLWELYDLLGEAI